MIRIGFVVFLVSLGISLAATRLAINLSHRIGFLDVPRTLSRKNHRRETPLLGGTAIFCSFFGSLFGFLGLSLALPSLPSEWFSAVKPHLAGAYAQIGNLICITAGGFLILVLGLKDDRDGVTPLSKLAVILGVALMLFFLDIRITLFVAKPLYSFLLTLVWILFLTNAFNLLDNMDGLSSATAVACSVILAGIAAWLGQYFVMLYLCAFAAVLLGFFRYNYFGGRIFMGDSGALFLGYNLAVAAILESFYISGKSDTAAVFIPAFVFAVPIFDTLSVVLIRIQNGRPVYKGDLNHFSHRLLRAGFSKKSVVSIHVLLSLFSGSVSLILLSPAEIGVGGALLLFVSVLLALAGAEPALKAIRR
jgi:UDP-GlcNAc:undecaprenyl-phosphate GlcNAc-1-phosphate transferase